MNQKYQQLMEEAHKASKNGYAPYSRFVIGSAVLSKSGKVYLGTNIENASYGLTNCAERSALFNAVSNGDGEIETLAVWSPNAEVFPCGACRQVILELAPNADIVINTKNKEFKIFRISNLLPYSFNNKDLK